jgi:hypothetical protein
VWFKIIFDELFRPVGYNVVYFFRNIAY